MTVHRAPQQNSVAAHGTPSHGGIVHVPRSQYGCAPTHFLPHKPQLRMSLFSLTHTPPQQV